MVRQEARPVKFKDGHQVIEFTRPVSWGKISDEEFQRVAKQIGGWHGGTQAAAYYRDCTRDAFRNFARSVGDSNPFYNDDQYGANTRWGYIAHPEYYVTLGRLGGWIEGGGGGRGGFPGVHGIHCSSYNIYYAPIRLGDRVAPKHAPWDLKIVPSRSAGKMVDHIDRGVVIDLDRGLSVMDSYGLGKRWEREAQRERREKGEIPGERQYAGRKRWIFTDEELETIWNDYDAIQFRGATPRYWEDVEVGETLPSLIRGPWCARETVACYMGSGAPFILASGIMWHYFRRSPGVNVPDPETHTPDVPERTHIDRDFARYAGAPDMFDLPINRPAWSASMVSNWMGDDGFIRELCTVWWMYNMYGDVTWVGGQVVEKYRKGKENLVKIHLVQDNQRYRHGWGLAVVSLPSRERGPVVLPPQPPDPSTQPYAPLPDETRDIVKMKDPGLPFQSHFKRTVQD